MDQDAMVNVNLPGGWRLVDRLAGRGFPVEAAFWAKLEDYERWLLYLASPVVDEQGLQAAYRLVLDAIREDPEWGIDVFTVTVLSAEDPMSKAAADLVRPKVAAGSVAVANPRPYRGVTRCGGRSLGGTLVDGAFIYPPWEPGINPVG